MFFFFIHIRGVRTETVVSDGTSRIELASAKHLAICLIVLLYTVRLWHRSLCWFERWANGGDPSSIIKTNLIRFVWILRTAAMLWLQWDAEKYTQKRRSINLFARAMCKTKSIIISNDGISITFLLSRYFRAILLEYFLEELVWILFMMHLFKIGCMLHSYRFVNSKICSLSLICI